MYVAPPAAVVALVIVGVVIYCLPKGFCCKRCKYAVISYLQQNKAKWLLSALLLHLLLSVLLRVPLHVLLRVLLVHVLLCV